MILSTTIIEDIRLDFAVWLAKRARKFRCDDQDIVAALQESHHVTATHPAADVAPTSSAGTGGDTDRQPNLPDGANDMVGGFPVAAAPYSAEETGENVIESESSVTGGESAATVSPAMASEAYSAVTEARPSLPEQPVDSDSRSGGRNGAVCQDRAGATAEPDRNPGPKSNKMAHEGTTSKASVSKGEREKETLADTTPKAAETPVVHPHRGESLASKIRALQERHPDWTARQIADWLGKDQKHINAAAKAAGITIHRLTAEEVIARRREGGRLGGSVSPARAKAPLPVAPPSTVLGTAGADETYRTIKKPKGQRFRLRTGNGTGKYLHMSCVGLVPGTDYAWTGTEAQMVAVRSKFPETLDMREEPVT